jgi:hypothetical protein
VTKKRGKTAKQGSVKKAASAGQKKTVGKSIKAAPTKPAAPPAAVATKTKAPARPAAPARAAAPRAAAASMPSAIGRAERLREDIQRSKMTHPDPWGYAAKARGWSDRAERLVADAQTGRDVRAALDALTAELDADREFREARRLF